jgi:hypothetical protein
MLSINFYSVWVQLDLLPSPLFGPFGFGFRFRFLLLKILDLLIDVPFQVDHFHITWLIRLVEASEDVSFDDKLTQIFRFMEHLLCLRFDVETSLIVLQDSHLSVDLYEMVG